MGLERGVRPMGAWSTSTTSLIASQPTSASTWPTGSPRCCFAPCVPVSRDSSCRNSTSCTRVDFPDPDTPVTAVSVPSGMRVSTPWRLCRRAPLTSSQRRAGRRADGDRKSTRLNSSHVRISYAVFYLKKKKKQKVLIYVEIQKKKKKKRRVDEG